MASVVSREAYFETGLDVLSRSGLRRTEAAAAWGVYLLTRSIGRFASVPGSE